MSSANSCNGFPTSELFEVLETASAGRGVFAVQTIPKGTKLLESPTPISWVIFDEYLKEVCAQCFAYDRGKAWKIKDPTKSAVFCSERCQTVWLQDVPDYESQAHDAIHALLKRKRRRKDDTVSEDQLRKPSASTVTALWTKTEQTACEIREGRKAPRPSKSQRRTIEAVQSTFLDTTQDSYRLRYLFTGLCHSISHPISTTSLAQLAADPRPYKTTFDLTQSTIAYLALLTLLPSPLLPHLTQSFARVLHAHSSHNAFSLRSLDEGEGAGSEYFGYGVWPEASYWNHSCAPNVRKERMARGWGFWTAREVGVGEELCISYLGGDERWLETGERRKRLEDSWGFVCGCGRCQGGDDGMDLERGVCAR